MPDINPITGSQSNIPTASVAPPGIGEEFNSFIQLLTAQIRNQDPLSPLDSTQFVEQLATFSSLEQQVRSNTSLDFIATAMNDMLTVLASDWLGQSVSVESSWVPYTGEDIHFDADIPDGADRAILTISSVDGDVTWTETLDLEAEAYIWDGRTQSGDPVSPDSLLNIKIEVYRDGEYLGAIAPGIITTVTDIGSENGKIRLGTASYLTTDLVDARKIGD